jgi:hypothetical protein
MEGCLSEICIQIPDDFLLEHWRWDGQHDSNIRYEEFR